MTTVGVTVLFTDLVGSTELSTRLGADAADRLRRTHFALIRPPVEEHCGTEVKNLGDGIMAVFPSSAAALDAAVAIQQALHRHTAVGTRERLEVRIGVAAGDCTPEGDDYFGEAVIIAARLCARAGAGEILVPDYLRHLAPRGRYSFESLGTLALKGIPEAVAAASVRWEPPEANAHARFIGVLDRLADDA